MESFFRKNWLRALVIPMVCGGLTTADVVSANPLGEAVRSGDVQFERTDGALRILQGSDKAIIDWDSFSISAGELTEFIQPSERSAALNRVRGLSASQIDGALKANGNILLINPNGIIIGPSGTIDVNGFIASTLDISDSEFLAGGDLNFRGTSQQGIVNLGRISATGGDVFLIAATVENSGEINAPNGTVGLAAGNDVLLKATDDGSGERIFVRGASGGKKATGVVNKGTINANIAELKAHGGNVYALGVKNEGRVAATGVTKQGGQIFLSAGGRGSKIRNEGTLKAVRQNGDGGLIKIDAGPEGTVENAGTVDVSSPDGKGGEIYILGSQIVLEPGSLVISDGATGGGEIFIGGGQRGEDGELRNAENVTVEAGANISANATNSGDGGRVIVFAENRLNFQGNISAMGGPNGGNGGFIELSGKKDVSIRSLFDQVQLGAPGGGIGGTLLFDPNDIYITNEDSNGQGVIIESPVRENGLIDQDIINFLEGASLIIETDAEGGEGFGDIFVEPGANITWTSGSSLTFNADRDFNMAGAMIDSQGGGDININAGHAISIQSSIEGAPSAISGTSGAINVSAGGNVAIEDAGMIGGSGMAGDISITAASISLDSGVTLQSNGGNLNIAPIDPASDINIGAGALDSGLQLDDTEIATFKDGFSSITIGLNNEVFDEGEGDFNPDGPVRVGGFNISLNFKESGTINVGAVTFNDPTTLAAPNLGGEIFVNGQITGAGDASITINGSGPGNELVPSTTYLSAPIVTDGNDITIDDDVILKNNAILDTTGGGFSTGAEVFIAGTINSEGGEENTPETFAVNAGTDGGIFFGGDIGENFSLGTIDLDANSLQLANVLNTDSALTIDVQENFSLDAPGSISAMGNVTINANRGTSPNPGGLLGFPGIEINAGITSEDGAIVLNGTSGTGNAFDNVGVWLRAGSGLDAAGSIGITGNSQVTDGTAVRIDGPIFSDSGVQLTAESGDIEINRGITAQDGLKLMGSADEGTDFFVNGTIPQADLTVDGGAGLNSLDFMGFDEGPLELSVDQLINIQKLAGGDGTGDLLVGSTELGGTFTFGGELAPITYTDSSGKDIAVSSFENIEGSPLDDTFVFNDTVTLPGDLDGGGSVSGDTLDYSPLDGFSVDVRFLSPESGFAVGEVEGTGVDGTISGITNFIGSTNAENTFGAPDSGGTIAITGIDEFGIEEQFSASNFQNLIGGASDTVFLFEEGGELTGFLEGGTPHRVAERPAEYPPVFNTLSFESFGSPVTVDLENNTVGPIGEGFSNITNFVGSGETGDFIQFTDSNDIVRVGADNSGTLNDEITFESFERVNSGLGLDIFNFNGLFTFDGLIDGDGGYDFLNIFTNPIDRISDASQTVSIQEGRIAINPVWNFTNIENVGVTSGTGNDDFTTRFTSFQQRLNGGPGTDTLNFSEAPFGSGSPVGRAGFGPVFFRNFEILRFAPNPDAGEIMTPVIEEPAPAPEVEIPEITFGDLLRLQLENTISDPNAGDSGEIEFSGDFFGTGGDLGLGILQNALGSFSAIAQQGVVFGGLDSEASIAVVPFSLDGSGIQPSNFGIQLLEQALAPDANTELLAALGLDFGIFLVNPDGPFAIDLSGAPALPGILLLLQSNISPATQSELQSALDIPIAVLLINVDGPASLDSSDAQPVQATLLILNDNLSPAALDELNAALGIQ